MITVGKLKRALQNNNIYISNSALVIKEDTMLIDGMLDADYNDEDEISFPDEDIVRRISKNPNIDEIGLELKELLEHIKKLPLKEEK